jgi:hypothetical protein
MRVDRASLGLHIAYMKNKNSYTFLKSLTPTLIVAASILAGLLGGAKIISNGVVEANRFQFSIGDEGRAQFFDSATGNLFYSSSSSWRRYTKGVQSGPKIIEDPYDWVWYLEHTKENLKEARELR